jgi:hypothetical protein
MNPWLALFIVEAVLVLGAILIAVHKHGRHPLAGGPPDDNWWKASAWLVAGAVGLLVVAMFVDWMSTKMSSQPVTQAAAVSTTVAAAPPLGVTYVQAASSVAPQVAGLFNRVDVAEQNIEGLRRDVQGHTGDIAISNGRLDIHAGHIRTLQGSRVVVTQPMIADNSRGGFVSLSDCLQRTRVGFSRDGEVNMPQVQEFCAAHGWVAQTVFLQQAPILLPAPVPLTPAPGPAIVPPPAAVESSWYRSKSLSYSACSAFDSGESVLPGFATSYASIRALTCCICAKT